MPGAAIANITKDHRWFVGEDKAFLFKVTDRNDVLVNPTGWSFVWECREEEDDESAVITKNSPSQITVVNAQDPDTAVVSLIPQVQVQVVRADTIGLRPGWYKHGLRRISPYWMISAGDALLQLGGAH